MKIYEVEYFKNHYPHIFNHIVEVGESHINNFFISPKMRVIHYQVARGFDLVYPTQSGGEASITHLYYEGWQYLWI